MTTTHPGVVTHATLRRANLAFVVAELANEAAILLDRVKTWPRNEDGSVAHTHPEVRKLRAHVEALCGAIVHCAGVSRLDPLFYETRNFVYGRINQWATMWADAAYLRLPQGYADELLRDTRRHARAMAR